MVPRCERSPQVGYGARRAGAGAAAAGASGWPRCNRPHRVAPLIHPALPGEGVWRATRPGLGAGAPLLVTTLRNQPEYPRVVAGLAWIDTKRTTVTLNPGRQEPSVSIPRGSMDVPQARRGKLLATFNSGFKLSDSHGGFVLNGHTYATMQDGQATLVGYSDGRVDVIDWQYGPRAPSSVSFARQNLPLIVERRTSQPRTSTSGEWGATVGNAVLVWRSGIGVDRHGNLIYAAGEDQSVGQPRRHARPRRAPCARWSSTSTPTGSASSSTGAPGAGSPREPARRDDPPKHEVSHAR